ncbi:MAG: AEC family transporter [Turicibacter sp.]|nr:AEC family transporter [Turicibacter sp.]
MTENFIFSANAVFPIFLVIALGYFLKRKEYLSPKTVAEMNRLVFSFALPLLLFRNIYRADFMFLFNAGFVLWLSAAIFISFAAVWIFAEIFLRKQPQLIGAFVQAAFRSNYAIVGIPLVANVMGEQDTGIASLAAAFIVTVNNVLAVTALTAKDPQHSGFSIGLIKSIFWGVCTNPSIIAVAAAVALNLLNFPIPVIIWESVNSMAILCTPLALVAVGASIQVSEFREYITPAIIGSTLKIIIMPIVLVFASIAMGFRGEELAVLFVMIAAPTAIVSYAMAVRMNGNGPISAAIILITTLFSSITLTFGVYLLMTFDMI